MNPRPAPSYSTKQLYPRSRLRTYERILITYIKENRADEQVCFVPTKFGLGHEDDRLRRIHRAYQLAFVVALDPRIHG